MMHDEVVVSVLMLSYNQEKFIREAIESAVMQKTKFRFEIIISDDASTDNTQEIIREYAARYPKLIRAFCRKKNIGATKNLVSTLRKCNGRYIAFLEGDDFWVSANKLQLQTDCLLENEAASMCFTGANVLNDREWNVVYATRDILSMKNYLSDEKYLLNIPTVTIMIRNYFKDEPELLEYFLKAEMVGDRIMHAIALSKGYMKYIPEVTGTYRRITSGGDSFSSRDEAFKKKDTILARRVCRRISGIRYYKLWTENIAKKYKSLYKELRKIGKKELLKEYVCCVSPLDKIMTFSDFVMAYYSMLK